MRNGRSPRTPRIAALLAALVVVTLGLVRWTGGLAPPGSPIPRAGAPAPARPTESTRQAEPRASSSASAAAAPSPTSVPSAAGGAAATQPVFDLATLARRDAPEPSRGEDRFQTNDRFTAEDLAHPERYFEAAEQLPELRRDEERRDALEFFLAYRAQLERELEAAGRPDERAAVLAVIERYDAAIARMQSALATPVP